MTISRKIKTIDNKIEQNKAQCDLHRHTAKISDLSLGNVAEYEFLSCCNQKICMFTKGSELKKQTSIA